jgi:diguanylate cyclase (GGDEF)-like protein/PAS domain S-box-containing protein
MLRVLTCIAVEHDGRLVALAVAICLLSSIVAISLFHRAQATRGRVQVIWLALGTATVSCGIWATHFVAMLAYDAGFGFSYDVFLTVLSLVLAIAATSAGLSVALWGSFRWSAAVGGAIVGVGVSAMHYTGMAALEVPGRMVLAPDLVIASIVFGIVLGAAAFSMAKQHNDVRRTLFAALLLTLAILTVHFTGMASVTIIPDPTQVAELLSMSPSSLAIAIAGATASILGMSLVAAFADRQSEAKLRAQEAKLDTALQNMSQGLCMFDAQGHIILCNERYVKMMGLSEEFLSGRSLLELLRLRKTSGDFDGDPEEFFERVCAEMAAGKSSMKVLKSAKGRSLRVVDEPMAGGGWVATFEDITEILEAEAQISHMARHDPLTDLPNRTLFREQMEHALSTFRRDEQLAVLFFDLDHFKQVNDSFGHSVGDELLKAVTRRLRECVRSTDTIARLGGDEFAVVQIGTHSQPTEAALLASRLVDVIGAPYDLADHRVVIGASVGVSIAPVDSRDSEQLMKNADMALYRAKADGRGTYRFFEPEMDARARARRLLELELRAALTNGEFELYFQSINDLHAHHIIGFEALVRWNHPTKGMIPPTSFLPLAEETGLIVPLGEWVLRKACSEAARWSKDVRVAVNLSPAQFKNRNLATAVTLALSASGLRPDRLELEITEVVLVHDSEATLATLHILRGLGVTISMDDFGTGYSSLSYLRSFPFDRIKIDPSFVHQLATRGDSMAIVRAVTGLGKSLGIITTAGGVDTPEQLALLRLEGCAEVQGQLFGPPRPAAEVEELLSKSAAA